MTAALVVIAVAGVGMFFATWQTLGNVRTYLEDSQELNAALVEKLESLSSAAPAATNYDWCNLRLNLVEDTADGPPAAGLTTTLQKLSGGGQTDRGKSYPYTTQKSDEDGLVDYSPVPYGSYYVTVQTDEGHLLKKEIVIRPGKDMELTIVCPHEVPTGEAELAVSFDGVTLPETIDGEVWTLCRVYQQDFLAWANTVGQAYQWPYGGTMIDEERWLLWKYVTVLINPDGRMFAADWPLQKNEMPTGSSDDGSDNSEGNTGISGVWHEWLLSKTYSVGEELVPIDALDLPIGQYSIDAELVVLQPTPEEGQQMTWRTLTEEERTVFGLEEASIGFFLAPPMPEEEMEIEPGSTVQWTVKLNTNSTDGTITVVERPKPQNVSEFAPGSVVGGGGLGGGGFGGGGAGLGFF
ncbi:MAG: hypothetical protein DWQ34_27660 [Planctomycetota bacterium]|nr:MAG: hypothetical protein DWQ34_27660 [Planctomycetota bacterium]